jgi:hypothetical protein
VQVAQGRRGRRLFAGGRGALGGALVAGALGALLVCSADARPDGASDRPMVVEAVDGVPAAWTEVLNGYMFDPRTYGPRLMAIEREAGAGLPPIFQMAVADAYLRAGNRRAAERIFESSLTQNLGPPWSEFANLGMGTIRLVDGDQDGALDYFVGAAESEGSAAQALGNLGMGAALSASGRFAEAQEAYAETTAIEGVDGRVRDAARFGSAMALYGTGDYTAAAHAFDEIAQSDPNGPTGQDARYAAARARLASGDREASAAALRQLLEGCDPKQGSRRAPRALRNLDARAMGRNWIRNYRTTGWGNLEAKGNSMYSIGGCALARSTLRAIERNDPSLGAVQPIAAPAAARVDAAPAGPAKLPPAAGADAAPAASTSGSGSSPLPWVGAAVAALAALAGLWHFAGRGGRAR